MLALVWSGTYSRELIAHTISDRWLSVVWCKDYSTI
jgi:hypothetical protein